MKKRVVSMLLALVMVLGMLPVTVLAAGSEEEALGEVNIYNGEQKLSYLSINGRIRELIYTYFNHVDANGRTKEIPAYCVNPNTTGVPQTVGPGESIKYIAKEKGSDPKVMGTTMKLSTYSNYSDGEKPEVPDTGLKLIKLEKGTDTPLSGAVFEVVDPDGATVGTFATGSDGTVTIPLTLAGSYTVYERVAPLDHLLSDMPAQNIKIE